MLVRLLSINVDGAESKEIAGIPLFLGGLVFKNPPSALWAS